MRPRRYIDTQDKSDYPLDLLADVERKCAGCGTPAYVPAVSIEYTCCTCGRRNHLNVGPIKVG